MHLFPREPTLDTIVPNTRKNVDFSISSRTGRPAVLWWLTPVIPATQEAEIRRITVQSQPRAIVHETLSQKKPFTKKGWWSGSRCRP
jgi:hypothetical protein